MMNAEARTIDTSVSQDAEHEADDAVRESANGSNGAHARETSPSLDDAEHDGPDKGLAALEVEMTQAEVAAEERRIAFTKALVESATELVAKLTTVREKLLKAGVFPKFEITQVSAPPTMPLAPGAPHPQSLSARAAAAMMSPTKPRAKRAAAPKAAKAAKAKAAPKAKAKSGRLPRRSPEEIAQGVDAIVALLKKHPDGKRSEEIKKALGLDVREMPRLLHTGLEAKKLKSKGEKRATVYFAK